MRRRRFLRSTAGLAAGFLILRSSSSARTAQANERLQLAHVGVGGRGRALLVAFADLAQPVALCDVHADRAAQMFGQFPQLPKFTDFREMLAEMGDRVDGVLIATPDHTHAVATAAAIRAGKHVFTEKPLARTVEEARLLRQLVEQCGVASSMGNQGTASGPFRRALELIRDRAIGEVREVHVWNDQGGPGWTELPAGEQPVPAGLNWDLWLGPARPRPFHPRWLTWHGWRDFGTGNLGNWSSHSTNLPFMALEVDSLWAAGGDSSATIRVEAQAESINRSSFPRWETVQWDVPARGSWPAVRFRWHNGGRRPGMRNQLESLLDRGLDWGDKGAKKWQDWAGCLIVGEEGKIFATAHNATFSMLPEDKFRDLPQREPERVERSLGHERDWLHACRGGSPAWARFAYSGPLTEFNMLGNLATQFQGPLDYDPRTGRIVNHDEADRALRQACREGWSL